MHTRPGCIAEMARDEQRLPCGAAKFHPREHDSDASAVEVFPVSGPAHDNVLARSRRVATSAAARNGRRQYRPTTLRVRMPHRESRDATRSARPADSTDAAGWSATPV